MIYIFETEILNLKLIKISLQKIYGIGNFQAILVCKQLGFASNLKTFSLQMIKFLN